MFLFVAVSRQTKKSESLRPLRLCGNILKGISICVRLRVSAVNNLKGISFGVPRRKSAVKYLFLASYCRVGGLTMTAWSGTTWKV